MTRGKINYALLAVVIALSLLGLLMVYSAGSYQAQDANENALEPLLDQLLPLLVGIGAMIVLANIDYRFYKSPLIIYGFLGMALVLLAVVWIPGIGIYRNGSRRWLPLIGGLTLQPGEIAKFALVMFCAYILDKKKNVDQRFSKKNWITKNAWFKQPAVPILVVTGLMFFFVMKQPNLSTAGCLAIAAVTMLFVGGVDLRSVPVIAIVGGIGLFLLTRTGYRSDRLNFLDPWSMASSETYQLVQSLYAIASGGLFGTGIGQSRQKLLFLPYCDSDFIFAIICEELGLIGALGIILLFGLFIFLGFKIAFRCKDRFGSLLAMGVTVVFAVQVVLNIAVVTGMFPTTGLPLPFFSAGGTNLVIFLSASGLLLNISRFAQAPVQKIATKETPQTGQESPPARSRPRRYTA